MPWWVWLLIVWVVVAIPVAVVVGRGIADRSDPNG
jgi:hypothetical protein